MAFKGISLFSGAGGMDVGFENVGMEVIFANEINKDACATYAANHPNTHVVCDDIKNILNEIQTVGTENEIDIVFGGPPCQGFSVAGKMDPDDDRSKLIWEFLDVVKLTKPKVFVMENVKALAKLEKWKFIREAYFKKADSLGYNVTCILLNAADFGVSQNRERAFFIGLKKTIEFNLDDITTMLMAYKKKPLTLRKLFSQLPQIGTEEHPYTCTARITLAEKPVLRKSPYAGMFFNGMGRPLDLDGISNTLPASMGGNKTPIVDEVLLGNPCADNWIVEYHKSLMDKTNESKFGIAPSRLRRITIKEAAIIQSFPRDYVFKGSKSSIYTQIGNAVPCLLAGAVAQTVVSILELEKDKNGQYAML